METDGFNMSIKGLISVVFIICLSGASVAAQIRLVPRDKVEAVANPRLSADSALFAFETKHIYADKMTEDDAPKTFIYSFTNSGSTAIRIKRLVSTCSCMNAICSVSEVEPGQSGEIQVRYNPKGHPGRFERKVYVYTGEGTAPAAVLKLSVEVASGTDLSAEWPIQMGTIRLRRSEVTFTKGAQAVESIRFINIGRAPVSLGCETAFMPGCLSFSTDPSVVDSGEEGVIKISYDPSVLENGETIKIILKGLGVPPSKSTLNVNIRYQ